MRGCGELFFLATALFAMSSSVSTMQVAQQSTTVVVGVKLREAIEEAVERTLSSPEFSAQVTADIRNLAQTVKDIREGFRAVADDLVGFDNDEYKDKDGEVLRLRPRWLGYQTVSKTMCLSLAHACRRGYVYVLGVR